MEQLSTPTAASHWLRSRVGGTLHSDSRKVRKGDGFIAWPGAATDGRYFVQDALNAGASACMVEADGVEKFEFSDARIASYRALKAVTGLIAAEYFEYPSRTLDVVAVTGTNGKTSTAWWLAQALNTHNTTQSKTAWAYACGLIGTLGVGTPGQMVSNGLTTPDPVILQAELEKMKSKGAKFCAIEASSIGLAEHRLEGTAIRTAVFTNLTQDHLDYHGTMAKYAQAKHTLFEWPELKSAVINIDDTQGAVLAAQCKERGLDVWTISRLHKDARLSASHLHYTQAGMSFRVNEATAQTTLNCGLVGDYNVSNLLGVIAAMRSLGVTLQAACAAVSQSTTVPGRMYSIDQVNAPLVVIDYAHTPDALDKVLTALLPVTQARGGQLHCIFGCGGDRDAIKRPLMAVAAERIADNLVVTSDNPRGEDAQVIIAQIVMGFAKPFRAQIEPDRAKAIANTVKHANVNDVILIAGKGHEEFQEVDGFKHPFSDVLHAQNALTLRGKQD